MIEYSKVEWRVDLRTGNIEFNILDSSSISSRYPFVSCRSLIEADVRSLNVLRQNADEGKTKGVIINVHTRMVLGKTQKVYDKDIVPNMIKIRELYPEEFI